MLEELAPLTADLERPATQTAAEVEEMSAVLGNESRKGHWSVPPRVAARSVLGDCHIELQDAVLTSHVTVIEARATLGSVTVLVPDGVEARLTGKAILGSKSSTVRHASLPGAPVIEVQATAILGSVTVRAPSPARRLAGALHEAATARLSPPGDLE